MPEARPPFELERASRAETPVIVEVPHAGLDVPGEVRAQLLVGDQAIRRDSDLAVDQLWARAAQHGATLLTSPFSRYVVDLNRAPDDVDRQTVRDHPAPRPTQSRGVVWRLTTDGQPALREPITFAELERRLSRYHAPYHEALAAEIARKRQRFGYAIVVAGHSMPSMARGGREKRADVVPGSRGRTSASERVIDLVERHFLSAGMSVRHDDPYRGGWSTQRYGNPGAGVHAIQIELSRALYTDEATCEVDPAGAARLSRLLESLLDALGALVP
jgi:N-formylglutamate amidohydrolase